VASGYGKSVQELPDKVDWNRYVLVVRAKVRRLVLSELNRPSWQGKQGKTATEIRKHLLDKAQLCLGSILRALNDLVRLRLARRVTSENGKAYRRYVLTPMGRKIAGEIQR
jgi:DNA-binding MarR family transcriptional regulator